MKRIIDVIFIIGVAAIVIGLAGGALFGGCNKVQHIHGTTARKQPPPLMRKVAPASPQPSKPAKEILPRTVEYLDMKNGFRDAIFGQWDTNFSNLVLKEQDDTRQLKTYTRPDDVLSLASVPLESIEYAFFKGQLYKIVLTWKVQHEESVVTKATSTDIAPYCASLYGPPTQHHIQKDQVGFAWRGRKVNLLVTEFLTPGVVNLVSGGWSLPPTTEGRMIFESIPLRQAEEAYAASQSFRSQDGL